MRSGYKQERKVVGDGIQIWRRWWCEGPGVMAKLKDYGIGCGCLRAERIGVGGYGIRSWPL